MSKLEVDTIDTTSGGSGTLTIGSTQNAALKVTREATRTITGDGSTTTALNAGDIALVDVSSATATVQLPASPNTGDIVQVIDMSSNATTNNITIDRNSEKIEGDASNLTLEVDKDTAKFLYTGSTYGWVRSQKVRGELFVQATGGTETTSGNFKIHTFTSDGCFVVSSVSGNTAKDEVSYLVVAGGGGGGAQIAGGGGAGGFRENRASNDSYTVSPLDGSTPISLTTQTYPITVGGGGAGAPTGSIGCAPTNFGTNGSNSVFSTITSTGGGGGAGNTNQNGKTGGSGGAGGLRTGTGGSGNTPPVSPSQGSAGGDAVNTSGGAGGGGGGATAAGADASGCSPAQAGNGGAGATTSISGSSSAYAGGGGGGGRNNPASNEAELGTGGSGGGGDGKKAGTNAGGAGTSNTGGGGGGSGYGPCTTNGGAGGAGGSGIVIIRYKYQ